MVAGFGRGGPNRRLLSGLPFCAPGTRSFGKGIHQDDTSLRIGSHEVLADPLDQARRAAAGLYEMLGAEGIETVPVQPVVVFPGWTVRRPETFTDPEVLVVGDQSLEEAIRGAANRLEPRDVIAVCLLLEKAARPPAVVPAR